MKKSLRSLVIGLACLLALGVSFVSRGHSEDPGLAISSPQIVTSYETSSSSGSIYLYQYQNGYLNTWISGNVGTVYNRAGSGDVDNDGTVEVYAVSNDLVRTVRVNKKTTNYYFTQTLSIFDPGVPSGSLPSRIVEDIRGSGPEGLQAGARDCLVADVNGDQFQELVVQSGSSLSIYVITSSGLARVWETPADFEYTMNRIDAGDVDGDGVKEIVAACLVSGMPLIFDFDGAAFTCAPGQVCTTYAKGSSAVNLNDPKVGDADNDGANEIVCGGNNYRLMVWKRDSATGEYKLKFTSASLGYLCYADVGDVDGDGSYEIIAGNMGNLGKLPYLWIYAYDQSLGFVLKSKTKLAYSGAGGIEIGDLDRTGGTEVVVPMAGVFKVYHFVGADLASGVFAEVYSGLGGPVEIW